MVYYLTWDSCGGIVGGMKNFIHHGPWEDLSFFFYEDQTEDTSTWSLWVVFDEVGMRMFSRLSVRNLR